MSRFRRLLQLAWQPRGRYALAWLVAFIAAAISFYLAWTWFDEPRRKDGNNGHTQIDFGGQWLMGRLLVEGEGRFLYNRFHQRRLLRQAYPREDEVPADQRKEDESPDADADKLMTWLMGSDDRTALGSLTAPLGAGNALEAGGLLAWARDKWEADRLREAVVGRGGPLYPPLNAFIFAPLGLLSPQAGYRVAQVVALLLAFLAALGVRQLTRGNIWWPVAATLIIVYPGFNGGLKLGQNNAVTLNLLIWGWVLVSRGRPCWGGVVWGFLAFKPVWAVAFFLVPVLTRRWRMAAAMLATGTALAALTLPIVGWRAWLDWLHVGREGAELYNTDVNWVHLSRDLWSIPRRWLLDFSLPYYERDNLAATLASWALLLCVFELTVRLVVLRKEQARAPDGPVAAFVLLGAWLCCYHFMFYDVLLTALPLCLLFTEPRSYLKPIPVAIFRLPGDHPYYGPRRTRDDPPPLGPVPVDPGNVWVLNRLPPTILVLLLVIELVVPGFGIEVTVKGRYFWPIFPNQSLRFSTALDVGGTPLDTFCLMFLWLWCGWLWLRQPLREPVQRSNPAAKMTAEATPPFPDHSMIQTEDSMANGVKLADQQAATSEIIYPVRDGKPLAETGIHVMVMLALIFTLRFYYYRRRSDVYVIGNIFLFYEEGHPEKRKSPDVMVIKGVSPLPERRSFKTWEERAVPCVIFEITSDETAQEDQESKKQLYEQLGVREYFLFDPLHDYLERPLMGYRLIGDKYEPLMPDNDGGLLSAELGLRLVPEGTQLALYHFRTGERLPGPPEGYEQLEEALARARQAEEQVRQVEELARQAEERRRQAEEEARRERQRAEELAAELARMRSSLPGPQGPA